MSSTARAVPESKSLAFINALRGIAAMLVYLFHQQIHTFYHYPTRQIPHDTATWWLVYGFFDLGKYAVAVFFMVSGFLIPTTLRKPGVTLRQYALHRGFRLYPAYWTSIAVRILALIVLGKVADIHPKEVLVNLTMFQKFVGVPDFIGVFWTLQIELIFYILCALLFVFKKLDARWPMQLSMLGLALLCALARLKMGKDAPIALFIALMLMFFGDTLRARGRGEIDDKALWRSVAAAAIGIVPVCVIGYRDEGIRYVLCYEAAIATFFFAWRNAAWFERPGPRKKLLDYLGDISYSVYLFSSTVLMSVGESVLAATGSRLLTVAATLPTVLAISSLIYRVIEAPAMRLGRRIADPPTARDR